MKYDKSRFHADAKKPEALMRLYILTALVSIAVILFLTGVGIHRIYSGHIIKNAEEDAVNISKALLEEEREFLISVDKAGLSHLEAEKSGVDLFDQHIRKFLGPFDIVKIKIYNAESRIVYSTDPSIIGKVDPDNYKLKRALLGNNDSKLEKKDKVIDLYGERKFDVDVVETYVPVRDGAGNVIGSFEIYLDVSRYRAELTKVVAMSVSILAMILLLVFFVSYFLIRRGTVQLKEAQGELVRNEKLAMLGLIAGSMGHELRNPLGVMSNAVYFLKTVMTDADETVREYLDIIKQEIDTSQRIITDLLDFSRIKPPQTTVIPVHELIRQSLKKCAIPENARLQTDVPETLPKVLVDPFQMGQVFQNLITNAVQAMPDGGTLRVAARRVQSSRFKVQGSDEKNIEHRTSNVEPDGDFVEISVEDAGEGIAPENMDKLFQPLFTTKARGIGLGLAFSRKLAEANGGRIEVASLLGEGTTFTVILPAGGE